MWRRVSAFFIVAEEGRTHEKRADEEERDDATREFHLPNVYNEETSNDAKEQCAAIDAKRPAFKLESFKVRGDTNDRIDTERYHNGSIGIPRERRME